MIHKPVQCLYHTWGLLWSKATFVWAAFQVARCLTVNRIKTGVPATSSGSQELILKPVTWHWILDTAWKQLSTLGVAKLSFISSLGVPVEWYSLGIVMGSQGSGQSRFFPDNVLAGSETVRSCCKCCPVALGMAKLFLYWEQWFRNISSPGSFLLVLKMLRKKNFCSRIQQMLQGEPRENSPWVLNMKI